MPSAQGTDDPDPVTTLEILICEQVAALVLLLDVNRQTLKHLRQNTDARPAPEQLQGLAQLEERIGSHRRQIRSLQAEYEVLRQAEEAS